MAESNNDVIDSCKNTAETKLLLVDNGFKTKANFENDSVSDESCEKPVKGFIKVPKILKKCLPPRGKPAKFFTIILLCSAIWGTLYSMTGKSALPGGNIFAIYTLLICTSSAGFLLNLFSVPPIFGMLVVGFILRNVPNIDFAKDINPQWSSNLRSVALAVILLRSGLGLDIQALKKLKYTVSRLAFTPCLTEAVTIAISAYFILGMPWLWGFQLGFILSAGSPAVVVPQVLVLQEKGYGIQKGVPTLVVAATSCDDVLAISLFGVFYGVAFSDGNLLFNIFRGPLETVIGLLGGFVIGMLLWYIPSIKGKNVVALRSALLLFCCLFFLFGFILIKLKGAGALGVLCMATVAGYGWGEQDKVHVEKVFSMIWYYLEPLLFGLIGAEVVIDYLVGSLIGKGLAILFIGLVVRSFTVLLVVSGNKLSFKEKLFCAITWLPKATVQAAIGSIPYSTAKSLGLYKKWQGRVGIEILTIAVLSILVTAPLGALLIAFSGPKCLSKKTDDKDLTSDVQESNGL
ncbi:sodium/hydrogen exchanger 9B2 isoform X1 [Hydra vulgaris]|uniref:sodium/hydrogen exchanger 9B2 isoform X1 n=1 Tax=Hydra vulgaris TaxID=6087 RepID=UPI001F5E4E48|nr:sodium/hydrogen exchanger 9B2 [Hydra vulgaris]